MNTIINTLKNIIDTVGNLCGVLLLLMVANVFYDVLMRYFFNDVNIGMQELEWHLFATMFMFGIGYTLKEDAHVRVDIIYDQLSKKNQALITIIGSVILAMPFAILMVYFSWDYAYEAYSMGEGSPDPGGLPSRWIIRSVIPFSSIFLMLCITYVLLTQIKTFCDCQTDAKGEK